MRTRIVLGTWLVWLVAAGVHAEPPTPRAGGGDPSVSLGPDLKVRPLAPGFWLHVSTDDRDRASNGLIVPIQGGVLLVDTPWTNDQTERLLAHAGARIGAVTEALVTHSHPDRMGGIATLLRHHIPTRSLDLTVAKAFGNAGGVPEPLFAAAQEVFRDPRGFEVYYPGPGHTVDNTVVWFPRARLLHGGCLVKSEDTGDLGYVAEADLTAWPSSIAKLKARYKQIAILVPGHGKVGGPAALDRTLELLRRASPTSPDAAGHGEVLQDVPPAPDPAARYVFYVHGRILETQGRNASSPDFGPYAYDAILRALASHGPTVISEVRHGNAGDAWVGHLVEQVRRLRKAGVPARNIAIVGASKGGALTLKAAARLAEPELSYIVLAGCGEHTRALGPKLQGRVLSIYDAGDRYAPSCKPTFAAAGKLAAHQEIVLELGLDHGLLYTPRKEWVEPAIAWFPK
jgi:metallo-beta-lactamase class B